MGPPAGTPLELVVRGFEPAPELAGGGGRPVAGLCVGGTEPSGGVGRSPFFGPPVGIEGNFMGPGPGGPLMGTGRRAPTFALSSLLPVAAGGGGSDKVGGGAPGEGSEPAEVGAGRGGSINWIPETGRLLGVDAALLTFEKMVSACSKMAAKTGIMCCECVAVSIDSTWGLIKLGATTIAKFEQVI